MHTHIEDADADLVLLALEYYARSHPEKRRHIRAIQARIADSLAVHDVQQLIRSLNKRKKK